MAHGSVVHELVRKTGQISVHVISADDKESVPPKSVQTRPRVEPFRIEHYIGSAGVVGVALGVGLLIKHFVAVQSISLVFLTAVLASAAGAGAGPGSGAAVWASAAAGGASALAAAAASAASTSSGGASL